MDAALRRRLNVIIWLLGTLVAAVLALLVVQGLLFGVLAFAVAFFVIGLLLQGLSLGPPGGTADETNRDSNAGQVD